MFRDESQSVVRKARAEANSSSSVGVAKLPSKSKQSLARPASLSRNPSSPITPTNVPVEYQIPFDFNGTSEYVDFNGTPEYVLPGEWVIPLEVQPLGPTKDDAICYFMHSHAFPGAFWTTDLMTKFLLQSGGPLSQSAMQASMGAVSMAMLSRVKKVPQLMHTAQKEYATALTLLNDALTRPDEARSNQALGAVVLLAIYDVVTSRAPQDINLWTRHINGATALLEMRGPEQLKTETGLRLFMHLRYQIVVSCMQRNARVPESLLECSRFILDLRPNEAYANRLIIIIGRLSNLRSDVISGRLTDDQQIITGSSAIEADLISWLAGLPPVFSYEVHKKDRFDYKFQARCRGLPLYDEHYHVYPNLWACNSWNQYRCARIIVSKMILENIRQMTESSSLKHLSEEFRQQCQALRATIHRLAVDISRSVPFCIGVHHKSLDPTLPPPDSYLGGTILLWPLYLAGTAEGPTHPLRRWVVQCLRMLGNTFGLDQALAVGDIVASDPGILPGGTEEEQSRFTEEEAVYETPTSQPAIQIDDWSPLQPSGLMEI
ncbi:hypothetical protein N7466_001195 [Penicillium verhagenii]|uniref:uncharacterized protein n=1 Tax=Penicillium verhagenii TaxID=1562060 RepID=UPI002544FB74|nr:uncharacterized protein N7466_001195 [Penicillium verhagenii]KAJ5948180.1 hypothetical protein N7466_001195 [Penicillium verhagenii]